jgi:drug/metabolite transporter (DMT)-like permease
MLTAIVLLTIGSALTKRKKDDRDKFKTMLTWFGIALIIILIAVPWPFSPFAQRPYLR